MESLHSMHLTPAGFDINLDEDLVTKISMNNQGHCKRSFMQDRLGWFSIEVLIEIDRKRNKKHNSIQNHIFFLESHL